MGNPPVPDSDVLDLGCVVLQSGIHFEASSNGIVILKSGHQRIKALVTRSPNPQEQASMILDRALHNPALSEATFDPKFRPASILKGLSRRHLATDSYVQVLAANLEGADERIVRCSAKILAHMLVAAADYPDLRTLLHCFFRTEWMATGLFMTFVRNRLRETETKAELIAEWNALKNELDRFADYLGPQLAAIGTSRTCTADTFAKTLEDLVVRLEAQKILRLADIDR